MDTKFLEILERAGTVFMRYGVRSVTMDDIARELKISKKTLYKYVKDKSDLVNKIMAGQCEMEKGMISGVVGESENAIDELMRITEMFSQQLAQMNPSVMYDLEKYYPEAWEMLSRHKNDFVLNCVQYNLERGVKEGIYRDNLNPEIIAKLYVMKIDTIFDPAIFPVGKYTYAQIHIELMRYHIRGVANEKGMKYLAEKIKKDHSNL